ncbi:hypothetical protein LDENG_00015010, partial [Lucifuga dentata]
HTAEIVQEWFEEHDKEFKVLTWPPNSPDLNPIEHLWDVMEKQVRSMEVPPPYLQDLKDLLLKSWCQIPQDTFRGLVESMPQQVRAVLAARGDLHNIRQVVLMLWLKCVKRETCVFVERRGGERFFWFISVLLILYHLERQRQLEQERERKRRMG